MQRLTTATGSPFQYKTHPDGKIIVYPADSQGKLQGKSALVITPFIIRLVKQEIQKRGEVAVGASRDNPPPGSLGALIKSEKQSPQQLSYLIRILEQQGVCEVRLDGQKLIVKHKGL
jgi:hypothetical protein